ncbi:helix-turn-helix domain-containing protein [Paenibacillus sp. GCM10027626]|uniref:AraC family transcriptional regulator n=1 Tax=Paenibacillus sp. GCM10027626 TaxID=3273411 RepID=UPI003641730E
MKLRNYGIIDYHAPTAMRTGGIHHASELLYLASGNYRMRWLGEDYQIERSALFLISPNTPHDLTIQSKQAAFWYMELEQCGDSFPQLQDILLWNNIQCNSGSQPLSSAMQHCISGIPPLLQADFLAQPYSEAILMQDVLKLLLFIAQELAVYRKETLPSRYDVNKDIIKTLTLYMETNYKQPISLQTLTAIANYQSTYLIKHFKKETGLTPIQYLLQLRMNAAKNYLDTSDMPIKEVAAECGFGSIHHFSGEFKRKFGLYPSEWRMRSFLFHEER